jgi:hypothetical protein
MRHHTSGSADNVISFPRMAVKQPALAARCLCGGGLPAGTKQLLRADEHLGELRPPARRQQIAQRLLVERRDEGLDGLVQLVTQAAVIGDRAGVGGHVEAFDEAQVRFGPPDDVAEPDRGGVHRQAQTAAAPGNQLDVAVLPKCLRHANQVMLRDAVGVADVTRRHHLVWMRAQIEQDTQGVVGVKAELHVDGPLLDCHKGASEVHL